MNEKVTKQEALEALKHVENLMGSISGRDSIEVARQYIEGDDKTVKTRYDALVKAGIPEEELALVGENELQQETSGSVACDLFNSFVWQETEQKHDYWDYWHEKLIEREEGHG